jgi:hypothetical protein
VDPVCGEDHRRVLVGGGWRCEPSVGWGCVPWVTGGLDEVKLAGSLHFVAEPIHEHTRPWRLVQRGAEREEVIRQTPAKHPKKRTRCKTSL